MTHRQRPCSNSTDENSKSLLNRLDRCTPGCNLANLHPFIAPRRKRRWHSSLSQTKCKKKNVNVSSAYADHCNGKESERFTYISDILSTFINLSNVPGIYIIYLH